MNTPISPQTRKVRAAGLARLLGLMPDGAGMPEATNGALQLKIHNPN